MNWRTVGGFDYRHESVEYGNLVEYLLSYRGRVGFLDKLHKGVIGTLIDHEFGDGTWRYKIMSVNEDDSAYRLTVAPHLPIYRKDELVDYADLAVALFFKTACEIGDVHSGGVERGVSVEVGVSLPIYVLGWSVNAHSVVRGLNRNRSDFFFAPEKAMLSELPFEFPAAITVGLFDYPDHTHEVFSASNLRHIPIDEKDYRSYLKSRESRKAD